LIYAPPGVGKTTVLKDIIRYVSGIGLRCAVIDSRGELDVSAVLCDRIFALAREGCAGQDDLSVSVVRVMNAK
jgi:stage III sporulation protein SpoIIIAA